MIQNFNFLIFYILFSQSIVSQTVTAIWIVGDLSKEISQGSWLKLEKNDEFEFSDKIKLTGKNAHVIFRISGLGNLEVIGDQSPSILKDIYQYKIDNNKNIVNTSSSWLSELFSYKTSEGLAPVSGVSRGADFIDRENISKKQFSISHEVNILKNHKAVIYWQPSGLTDETYKVKLKIFDDTTFITNDTFLNIPAHLLNECIPCEIQILKPIQKFENTITSLYLVNLTDISLNKMKYIDNKINDNPNISAYKFAKIILLINEGFIATAHSYFLKYIDDPLIKSAYDNFLKDLNKFYFQND